jgi:hypothetical protein
LALPRQVVPWFLEDRFMQVPKSHLWAVACRRSVVRRYQSNLRLKRAIVARFRPTGVFNEAVLVMRITR